MIGNSAVLMAAVGVAVPMLLILSKDKVEAFILIGIAVLCWWVKVLSTMED